MNLMSITFNSLKIINMSTFCSENIIFFFLGYLVVIYKYNPCVYYNRHLGGLAPDVLLILVTFQSILCPNNPIKIRWYSDLDFEKAIFRLEHP